MCETATWQQRWLLLLRCLISFSAKQLFKHHSQFIRWQEHPKGKHIQQVTPQINMSALYINIAGDSLAR